MEKIFLSVLNMSLTASFVIVAIMLARLPLKKAPKIISYALWAVAGFRLVFPFTLESVFSLLPFKSSPIPQDIGMQAAPRIDSGITTIDNAISAALPAATPAASVNPLRVWLAVGSYVWLFGIAVMLIYSLVSIILLKRKLRGATLIEGNLFEADNLKTPFVIRLFRPKIYIPAGLSNEERRYIVLHEQTHIKRHDHIVKMFAYFVLCLHWFNPLTWAAFVLMGADMEMSCDERVMKELGVDIKNAYSLSLVRVAAGRKILNGSPLAFGEGGMKERIKNVLNFKKRSRVIIIAAVVLVAVLSVGFAVNRVSVGETTHDLQYFDANGFQLGNIISDEVNLTPIEPLSGNQYDHNFEEVRYSLDTESGVIRKMLVPVYDNGIQSAFNTGLDGANPWYTIEQITDFFSDGKHGWQDREQRLRYVEYTQKEGWLSVTVRFVYTDGESDGISHRLVWVLAESSLPYPVPMPTATPIDASEPIVYNPATLDEAREIVVAHYPDAVDIAHLGDETISYTNPPAPVEVYTFEVDVNGETIICAVSKERGIFFTYSYDTWWAFTGLKEGSGETRPMTLADVRAIAEKIGPDLTMSDLRDFTGEDAGSGLHVMQYYIEDEYMLAVGSDDGETVMYATFVHATEGGENESIDIRYYDVDKFIADETKELVRPLPEPVKAYIQPTEAKWTKDQTVGADMAQLDFANEYFIIFHGYFGLYVYDLQAGGINRSLDLAAIGCNYTQGDDYCEVAVSADGSKIYLHPLSKDTMYVYDLSAEPSQSLYETAYQWPTPNERFRTVGTEAAISEMNGIYSSQAVEFEWNDEKYYGYLYTSDWTLGTLHYVADDEVYALFE